MDFKYIEIVFERIQKQITELKTKIIISGIECSGKTHILKKLETYYEKDKTILFLTSNPILENLEFGVFLSTLSKVGEYKQIIPIATEIIRDTNQIVGIISEFLLNYKKNRLQSQLFSFSEAEIEILNRINLICKKKELIILADDVEKWDLESKNFLKKLIALQNNIACNHQKDIIFVLTSNNIKSLNLNLSDFYYEEINVALSYRAFSEEIKKINSCNDKIIRELYDITKGNIGLIANIKEYIDFSLLTGTESLQKQLFQILEKRIASSNKITGEIMDALQTATVIGKEFNLFSLKKLLDKPLGTLDNYINLGCEEKFITKEENSNYYYFSTNTLYDFFVSKLNGRSADCHYKFAKILEKIAPYNFYLRYFHMKESGNIKEAIPLLTVHCIRQCIEGRNPSYELLALLQKYNNYWDVYQTIKNSLNNNKNDNPCTNNYNLIESSDVFVHPIVTVEKDYILCLLRYRSGNINDFREIEHILTEYFNNDIDFSQHIRIGLLLFLLYCNRLGEYEKAKKIEKKITLQIQQEISNCDELQKEIRIIERVSPALYSNEVAYIKTKRSLEYFESKKIAYGKEYIMSLTNFLGVGMYLIGTTTDLKLSWEILFSKACMGIEFLNNSFSTYIYGIPKLINNYILIGVLSKKITFCKGIEMYDSLLLNEDNLPSKPLIECNRLLLEFQSGVCPDIIKKIKTLYSSSLGHEYYRFVIGLNYINILIVKNFYKEAKKIFGELNYLIPTISRMDELYINKHYYVLKKILEQKICFSSAKEYFDYFEKNIYQGEKSFPDIWKNANMFSDLQYWSEY